MRKIAVVANNSGGLFGFRKDLLSACLKKKYSIVCLTPFDTDLDNLSKLGVQLKETPLERRGLNPIKDLSLIFLYLRILNKENPDLVITYTIKPNIYAGLICRLKKIPYAVNITGLGSTFQNEGLLKKLVTAMYKVSAKKAKVVFFENIENLETFVKLGILKYEQTQLLNGAGVNLEKFKFEEYPRENDTIRFLFMGRVMAEKGVNELFEAMQRLYKNGYNFELDVLGNYEEDYKNIINKFENEGWLKYHGYQNDVKPFIKNSHCFVLPSWHEGMANTNLESGAMGRPVITSNIHGCLEAVVDGKTGFLVEPKNAGSLYEKLKEFIELPYEKKCEMGKESHNYIAENFDKKDVVEKTIQRLQI